MKANRTRAYDEPHPYTALDVFKVEISVLKMST